jgi:hypothetical protein
MISYSSAGICEPVGSEQCKGKNTFLETCSDMDFKCDGIDNDAGKSIFNFHTLLVDIWSVIWNEYDF